MQIFHFKLGFALALKKLFPELTDEEIVKCINNLKFPEDEKW